MSPTGRSTPSVVPSGPERPGRPLRVLVTGASGFIGSAVTRALRSRGDEVWPLVRSRPAPGEVGLDWEGRVLDASRLAGRSLEGLDAVVHLAGAPIATRWSARRLERIRASRIVVGDIVASAVAALERPPSVFVGGSAVGFYGDRGEEVLDESSAPGSGTLADLCASWEASTRPASARAIRVVHVRTGIVLGGRGGAEGGVLAPQLPLYRLGLGARLGDGVQWTSWVSLDDEVAAIVRAVDDETLCGPLNVTSPQPVRNGELTDAIARALGRRARLRVPAGVLRLALGRGPADELLLASQRVLPAKLLAAGFRHAYPGLDEALEAALAPAQSRLAP